MGSIQQISEWSPGPKTAQVGVGAGVQARVIISIQQGQGCGGQQAPPVDQLAPLSPDVANHDQVEPAHFQFPENLVPVRFLIQGQGAIEVEASAAHRKARAVETGNAADVAAVLARMVHQLDPVSLAEAMQQAIGEVILTVFREHQNAKRVARHGSELTGVPPPIRIGEA